MAKELNRLSPLMKFSFGFGQLSEGIKTSAFSMFLLLFYNQVLGVSGTLCGIALAIAVLFDALSDPLVGNLSDGWRSRLGRRHPFLYASAIPMAVFFFLLFNPPNVGEFALFAWLLAFTILSRTAMTFFSVPHLTLGAELSSDFHERTALAAWKQFFGAVGYICVFVLGFVVFFAPTKEHPNGQLNPAAYEPFTAWLALLIVLSILASAAGTHKAIDRLQKSSVTQRFSWRGVFGDCISALRNDSFAPLLFGFAVIVAAGSAAAALILYMMTFFWQLESESIFVVLMASPAGGMAAYATSRQFFARFDKRLGVMVGGLVWFAGHALIVPVYLAGWLPELGSSALTACIAFSYAFAAYGIGQVLVGVGTMIADIVDQHELDSKRRMEGTFYGVFSFLYKASVAIGSLVSGFLLDLIGWPAGGSIRTAADVQSQTIEMLGIVYGPLVGILALPSLFLISRYRLNRDDHQKILNALAERREADANLAGQ